MTLYMREKLRSVRTSKNLTQKQVSEMAGLSLSYYTEIELGKKQLNERRAKAIAKALRVSISDILEDHEVNAELEEVKAHFGQLSPSNRAVVLNILRELPKKR